KSMFTRCLWCAAAACAVASLALTAADDPYEGLKAGASALDAKRFPAAISALVGLPARIPKLADYAGWFRGSAQFEPKDYAGALKSRDFVWKQSPASPLSTRAAFLAARASEADENPEAAVEILRKNYASLPQPQGDLAMATAFAAA